MYIYFDWISFRSRLEGHCTFQTTEGLISSHSFKYLFIPMSTKRKYEDNPQDYYMWRIPPKVQALPEPPPKKKCRVDDEHRNVSVEVVTRTTYIRLTTQLPQIFADLVEEYEPQVSWTHDCFLAEVQCPFQVGTRRYKSSGWGDDDGLLCFPLLDHGKESGWETDEEEDESDEASEDESEWEEAFSLCYSTPHGESSWDIQIPFTRIGYYRIFDPDTDCKDDPWDWSPKHFQGGIWGWPLPPRTKLLTLRRFREHAWEDKYFQCLVTE